MLNTQKITTVTMAHQLDINAINDIHKLRLTSFVLVLSRTGGPEALEPPTWLSNTVAATWDATDRNINTEIDSKELDIFNTCHIAPLTHLILKKLLDLILIPESYFAVLVAIEIIHGLHGLDLWKADLFLQEFGQEFSDLLRKEFSQVPLWERTRLYGVPLHPSIF